MSIEPSPSYALSFTAASLRPELARIVAEIYLEAGSWKAAKDRILATNALQCSTTRSAERLEREFRKRLSSLSEEQIRILSGPAAEDRTAMAWLAVIKFSPFAFEFAAEVLRDKAEAHDPVMRPSDYESYVDAKMAEHPELKRLTDSSRAKVRQVLTSMLVEVGLLGTGRAVKAIHRIVLSPAVVGAIVADDRRWLAGFLVPDAEIDQL